MRVVLSQTLGAVTTVAVAWAAAIIDPTIKPPSNLSVKYDSAGRMWIVWDWRTLGLETWEFWQHEPDLSLPREFDDLTARFHPATWVTLPSDEWKNGHDYTTTAFGLPALCLKGTDGSGPSTYLCLGPQGTARLPVEPIWRGLAIDTGAWTATWAALLLAPGLLRSRRRARWGCCPSCGYNLAGLPRGGPCPECVSKASSTRSAPP